MADSFFYYYYFFVRLQLRGKALVMVHELAPGKDSPLYDFFEVDAHAQHPQVSNLDPWGVQPQDGTHRPMLYWGRASWEAQYAALLLWGSRGIESSCSERASACCVRTNNGNAVRGH